MATHKFFQLDVFTSTPLQGNPLAVFPDAEDIEDDTMQAIAREMNLSETTFVTPSDEANARVRFFTPMAEIPLAGHPTIGTWWLLAELGRVIGAQRDGTSTVTQETNAGVLEVDLTFKGDDVTEVVMTQAIPQFLTTVDDRTALGLALGGGDNLVADEPVAEVVSTALPQLIVPIANREALSALPSGGAGGALIDLLRQYGTDCAMLYVLEGGADSTMAYCRMFAPGLGVPEDPATGSAAGALGAHLVHRHLVGPQDGRATITVRQGAEIGRPSEIHVEVSGSGDDLMVRVGGSAVRVIEGEVTL